MRSMLRENITVAPTARTLHEIQEKCRKPSVEVATNLYIDILKQTCLSLKKGEDRRLAVVDASSLLCYQEQTKSSFLNCIGGLPQSNVAASQIMGRHHYGSFILEKILLSPRKGTYASASVYIPTRQDGRCPAVLLVIGHTDQGKADPEYQRVAQMLAHAGFVTMVLDPVGEGERFEHYEAEMDFQPIQGCSGEHDLLDWKCKLMGLSLARYFVQDGIAALSYLASREDVDPCRIALTGHSGGGTQTCMLMLAASDRLAAAAPCAYVTDTQAMMACGVDPDNEMIWPGSVSEGLDYVDLLAGMTPKPILFLTNQHDFFPREGTMRTYDSACRLWRAAGSATLPELATACSEHAYPDTLAQAVTRFFSRHLLGKAADLSSFAFTPLTDREIWCTPHGMLLKAYPDMRTIHSELLDELAICRKQRSELSAETVKAWLTDAIHCDRIAQSPEPRVFAEGICGHYAYRCLAWRPQAGYWNVGALLRDMRCGGKPLPTVIALWPEGLSRLVDHSNWIHRAIRNGWQVLVMDVTASGALLPAGLGGSGLYIGWGTMYKLNAYLLQLKDSLFALRTRQAIVAVDMLRQWPEADGSNLCYYVQGEYSRYASIASLLTGVPASVDEDYQTYEEIVSERYHDQTHTHEWIFPGVLRYLDTEDIKRYLQLEGLHAQNPAGT